VWKSFASELFIEIDLCTFDPHPRSTLKYTIQSPFLIKKKKDENRMRSNKLMVKKNRANCAPKDFTVELSNVI
jgi:hypothetical protein